MTAKEERPKIYERNPITGTIRWRYFGEDPESYGWPSYGNVMTKEEENKVFTGEVLSAKE
jgi:hypothetical protein